MDSKTSWVRSWISEIAEYIHININLQLYKYKHACLHVKNLCFNWFFRGKGCGPIYFFNLKSHHMLFPKTGHLQTSFYFSDSTINMITADLQINICLPTMHHPRLHIFWLHTAIWDQQVVIPNHTHIVPMPRVAHPVEAQASNIHCMPCQDCSPAPVPLHPQPTPHLRSTICIIELPHQRLMWQASLQLEGS